jgi:hypothetical protein
MSNFSPFGNLTAEIAKSKAMAKVRGPFLTVCSACGKYHEPNRKEAHLKICRPKKVHLKANMPTVREIQKELDRLAIQRKEEKYKRKALKKLRKKLARKQTQASVSNQPI